MYYNKLHFKGKKKYKRYLIAKTRKDEIAKHTLPT